jgi:hypothetical protein
MAAYRTAARLFPGLAAPLAGLGTEYARLNNMPLAEHMFAAATRCTKLTDPPYHLDYCADARQCMAQTPVPPSSAAPSLNVAVTRSCCRRWLQAVPEGPAAGARAGLRGAAGGQRRRGGGVPAPGAAPGQGRPARRCVRALRLPCATVLSSRRRRRCRWWPRGPACTALHRCACTHGRWRPGELHMAMPCELGRFSQRAMRSLVSIVQIAGDHIT